MAFAIGSDSIDCEETSSQDKTVRVSVLEDAEFDPKLFAGPVYKLLCAPTA